MKVVKGLTEARTALLENRGLNLDHVPPRIQAGIEEIFGEPLAPTQVVELILKQVREQGDVALVELTRKLDGTDLTEIEVPLSAISDANDQVPDDLVEALTAAAHRIRKFHEASRARSWADFTEGYGALVSPVGRVGAYIPGGTALYPSTVLMTAIPAKVAGVEEVIVCTPSKAGELPHPGGPCSR